MEWATEAAAPADVLRVIRDTGVYGLLSRQGFDYESFVKQIGRTIEQFGYASKWQIKSQKGSEHQHNSLGQAEVFPHTEGYDLDGLPPRYVALWCDRQARCGGGSLRMWDGSALLASIDNQTLAQLKREPVCYQSEPSLRAAGLGRRSVHPLVELCGRTRVLRLNSHADGMRILGEATQRLRAEIHARYEAEKLTFLQPNNSLIIWDNFRMVHSRMAFSDHERSLFRICVENGNVLE